MLGRRAMLADLRTQSTERMPRLGTLTRRGVCALALAGALLSCRATSNEWATSEPMLTGASLVTTNDAVERIAGAACRRQIACGRVGQDRDYADARECMVSQAASTKTVVADWACPSGVVEHGVARCEDALRSSPCSVNLAASYELPECRRVSLCGTKSAPR
jgi:hypothetical protein